MSRFYSINAIESFINKYCDECLFQGDSVIGLGDSIWSKKNGGYFIVKEIFLNCWSSGHKVRQVRKLSKKQEKMITDESINLMIQE